MTESSGERSSIIMLSLAEINTTMWEYTKNKQTGYSCVRSYRVCIPEYPSTLYHTTELYYKNETAAVST
jgi:hypothetical protein